jgi:hypothetical protein
MADNSGRRGFALIRLHGLAGRLLLVAGGVLVGGLIIELACVLLVGEQVKFPRRVVGTSFGLRINEPNATYRHQSPDVTVWFAINGQGMRADRDYPVVKPPGLKRIVALGDSFTMGYEVAAAETFSSVLEAELRSRGIPVEVMNAGVSGHSTAEECLYLERALLRYSPDLVLVSFYANDLVDNVRAGLFRLEGDRLAEAAGTYVPGGRLGNFLNTNPVFNFFSERSNAFVLVKERATTLLKWQLVQKNLRHVGQTEAGEGSAGELSYQKKLTAAIYERMYGTASRGGIPLVIQSIPSEGRKPYRLIEVFPLDEFDVRREGITFFPAKGVLDEHVGKRLLYWTRSHAHWTPLAHRLAGRALAELIIENRLLQGPAPRKLVGEAPR